MISINDKHPDLPKFITHKSDLNITTGANMSVRVSDAFFEAVEKDEDWVLSYTRKETGEKIEKVMKARDLMDLIAKTNWEYAEPGMLYWDNIDNWNLVSQIPSISYAGTNPCGEQPLPAGGACLLGAMNLAEYDFDDEFEFAAFEIDVATAVEYLNQVLDEGIQYHPLKEQRKTASDYRQIGLGFMGLGDLFVKKKIRYGSPESIELIHKIGFHMIYAAIEKSVKMAKETGVKFKGCNAEKIIASPFFEYNILNNPYKTKEEIDKLVNDLKAYGMHNSQLLTCAPTGTTSTIMNVSGGIEPIFALEFERTTKTVHETDYTYQVNPKAVKTWLKENGYSSIHDVEELPDYLITSRDIPWKERVDVQAAWQKHIDASISSTINLPESATVEDIKEIYMYAHEAGLKGTTIYRENCKRSAILVDTSKEKEPEESTAIAASKPEIITRKDLGDELPGTTHYKRVACGHVYITINRHMGKPVEVFMRSSKSGGCSANTEALGRMASTMLRAGVDPDAIVDSVLGIKCAACSALKGKGEKIDGLSCSDVMARCIQKDYQKYLNGEFDAEIEADKKFFKNKLKPAPKKKAVLKSDWDWKAHTMQENLDHNICPECGRPLNLGEGCPKCICGFSKC